MKDYLNYDLYVGDQVVCHCCHQDNDYFKIGRIIGVANDNELLVETTNNEGKTVVISRVPSHLILIHKRFIPIVINNRIDSPCMIKTLEPCDSAFDTHKVLDEASKYEDEDSFVWNCFVYKEYNDEGVNNVYDYIDLNDRKEVM